MNLYRLDDLQRAASGLDLATWLDRIVADTSPVEMCEHDKYEAHETETAGVCTVMACTDPGHWCWGAKPAKDPDVERETDPRFQMLVDAWAAADVTLDEARDWYKLPQIRQIQVVERMMSTVSILMTLSEEDTG